MQPTQDEEGELEAQEYDQNQLGLDDQGDEQNLLEDNDVASSDSQLQVNDPSQMEEQAIEKDLDPMNAYYEQEKEVVQWLNSNPGQKWVDRDFPTTSSQFYEDPALMPHWGSVMKGLEWRRPEEIIKDAKFMQADELEGRQGYLGASWFLGAVGVLGTRHHILHRLIVQKDGFDRGWVAFQFFKHGQWVQVIVDTLLPYERQQNNRVCLYSFSGNPQQFWLPLMQKAYAKLHSCYQRICRGSLLQGLVDLTGGIAEQIQLSPHDNTVWNTLFNFYNQKYALSAVHHLEQKLPKHAQQGPQGILENHYYTIMDMRDFAKDGIKLIRVRNAWGSDGVWTGLFCQEADDWEKYKAIKEELKHVPKTKKSDGSWWMALPDFLTQFNRVVVAKIFPENYQTYSIEGVWNGKTNGGKCPVAAEKYSFQQTNNATNSMQQGHNQRNTMQQGHNQKTSMQHNHLHQNSIQQNSMQQNTIQIMEEGKDILRGDHIQPESDDRWFNNPQFRVRVNKDTKVFVSLMQEDQKITNVAYVSVSFMIAATRSKTQRFWERPPQQDIVAQINTNGAINNQRQITHYLTLKKGQKGSRLYIIVPCINEQKKQQNRRFFLRLLSSQPLDVTQLSETLQTSVEGQWIESTAGGSRRIREQKVKQNPGWCRNPQYFVALQQPTIVKVILRKAGTKKYKNWKIGMTVCRYEQASEVQKNKHKPGHNLHRLLQHTAQILQPPVLYEIERKLLIQPHEHFKQSAYLSEDCSALLFKWNPTEGPFIIVPSSDGEDRQFSFKLTLYSNHPLELIRLDDGKNQVMVGRWEKQITAGGCHLNEREKEPSKRTWAMNPKYLLTFKEEDYSLEGNVSVKITLTVAEKQWKKLNPNTVSSMIGIYLLEKRQGKIAYSPEIVIAQTSFLPVKTTTLEITLGGEKPLSKAGYILMPSTYESKVQGTFILSVKSAYSFDLVPSK